MPNERLQLRLVRLSLRELNSKAYSKDIVNWIKASYSRNKVGLKKARYLLKKCDDVEHIRDDKDILFWFVEPKIRVGDVIRLGVQLLGSRMELAKELNSSSSQILEWSNGTVHPSDNSLDAIDKFAEKYKLLERLDE